MWDYGQFIGKAQTYFKRAQEHQNDDDEFAIWLLLGLEFLLRAPLARVHPTLLADGNGDSIMHAAGFPGGTEPRSIPTHMVISRLGRIVETFTVDRQKDAALLSVLRNEELHTSSAALIIETAIWLPKFTRVVDAISQHLQMDPTDLVGNEIVLQGRALVDAEDAKIKHHVNQLIAAARNFFSRLRQNEIVARRAKAAWKAPEPKGDVLDPDLRKTLTDLLGLARESMTRRVPCPACGEEVAVELQEVRSTGERVEGRHTIRNVIYVATGFECPICDLQLSSTAEIGAAGLQQQFSIEERRRPTYDNAWANVKLGRTVAG